MPIIDNTSHYIFSSLRKKLTRSH